MRPSVKQLSAGLQFHGEVDGKRQHYYVLSSDDSPARRRPRQAGL
jgi:hypothetical protein